MVYTGERNTWIAGPYVSSGCGRGSQVHLRPARRSWGTWYRCGQLRHRHGQAGGLLAGACRPGGWAACCSDLTPASSPRTPEEPTCYRSRWSAMTCEAVSSSVRHSLVRWRRAEGLGPGRTGASARGTTTSHPLRLLTRRLRGHGRSLRASRLGRGRQASPAARLSSSAQDITATNLRSRLTLGGPDDELKELGTTFNQLLDRLERSFSRSGASWRTCGRASHPPRPPASDRPSGAFGPRRDPLTACALLTSGCWPQEPSRSGCSTPSSPSPWERRAWAAKRHLISLPSSEPARPAPSGRRTARAGSRASLAASLLIGDPRLVERMVANLVDNAARYNVPGGTIRVWAVTVGGRAVLSAENSGPQVPQTEVQRLFKPFQRVVRDRTGRGYGVGLGLSIAKRSPFPTAPRSMLPAEEEGGLRVTGSFPPVPARAGNWPAIPSPRRWEKTGEQRHINSAMPRTSSPRRREPRYSPVRDSGPEL